MPSRLVASPLLLVLLLCPVTHLRADEGVLEINQTCAVNAGCFPGDTGGFPVTLGTPGSYRLTSNLDVPAGSTGITTGAQNVTVDLNGFEVRGQKGGLDYGVQIGNIMAEVRGGTIVGFDAAVMVTAAGARLVDLRILANDSGIYSNAKGLLIESCSVRGTTGWAFRLDDDTGDAVILNSIFAENTNGVETRGVVASRSSVYRQNGTNIFVFSTGNLVELGANLCGGNTTCP